MSEFEEPLFVEAKVVPDKHPARNFMWSVGLLGAFIPWLIHHGELSRSTRHFFWPVFGVSLLLQFANVVLSYLVGFMGSLALLCFSLLWFVVDTYVMGRYGAYRIKLCIPDYAEADYKRREKIGIAIGVFFIALWIIFLLLGSVGESMMDSGVNDLEVF